MILIEKWWIRCGWRFRCGSPTPGSGVGGLVTDTPLPYTGCSSDSDSLTDHCQHLSLLLVLVPVMYPKVARSVKYLGSHGSSTHLPNGCCKYFRQTDVQSEVVQINRGRCLGECSDNSGSTKTPRPPLVESSRRDFAVYC